MAWEKPSTGIHKNTNRDNTIVEQHSRDIGKTPIHQDNGANETQDGSALMLLRHRSTVKECEAYRGASQRVSIVYLGKLASPQRQQGSPLLALRAGKDILAGAAGWQRHPCWRCGLAKTSLLALWAGHSSGGTAFAA